MPAAQGQRMHSTRTNYKISMMVKLSVIGYQDQKGQIGTNQRNIQSRFLSHAQAQLEAEAVLLSFDPSLACLADLPSLASAWHSSAPVMPRFHHGPVRLAHQCSSN
jgi:hypothetical protein